MVKMLAAASFVAALSCMHLFAQPPQTPEQIEKERQKIQAQKIDSVVVWEYAFKGNKPEKKGRMDMVTRYDSHGNKILEGRYNKDEIDTKYEFRYDERNRLIEQAALVQFGTPSFSWKYTYDDNGRPIEAVYASQLSNAAQRRTFHYRNGLFTVNDGVLMEIKFYVNPNKVGYRDVFTHNDTTKRIVKSIRYRIDESIESKEEYSYDAAGNLTEIRLYNGMEYDEASGKLVSKKQFAYDAKGNLVSETEVNPKNQPLSKQVHFYDAEGRLAETTVFWAKKPPLKPSTLRKFSYTLFP